MIVHVFFLLKNDTRESKKKFFAAALCFDDLYFVIDNYGEIII